MKVVIDREKIRRRAIASHAASLGGLMIILGNVALSLWKPQPPGLTAFLLFIGFAVSTTGIHFANRWVKKPRPEEVLDRALKGLDDRCRLYHYLVKGPDHIVLTLSGLVPIETRGGEGVFEYSQGKWRQRISMGKALRFFVEEPLGNPITDAQRMATRLAGSLEKLGAVGVPIQPIVVFTHPAASLARKGTPIPVCQPKQLRGELPRNLPPLPQETYDQLRAVLDAGGPF
jgi:hypothetical protein